MSIRNLVENKTKLDFQALTTSLIAEFGITDKVSWDAIIPHQQQRAYFGGELLRLFLDHPNFADHKDIRTVLLKRGETSQMLFLFAAIKEESFSKQNIERITKRFIGGQASERFVVWFFGDKDNKIFKVVLSGKEGKKIVLKSLTFEIGQPFYRTYEFVLQEVYSKTNKFFVEPSERWKALWAAFDISVVNKQFYSAIKAAFDDLVENVLSKSFIKSLDVKKHFTIRLIGRIIFCWFLKKKNIISDNVLSSKAVQGYSNYYREILEKLFFDIFNTPKHLRKENLPSEICDYPFLNGGLFEDQEDDYRGNFQLYLPNEWFYDLFYKTLERYNFTIDENSSTNEELAIDPEMLGRIFENLLAEQNPETRIAASDRKVTGSYYTPREIVDFMVEQSIAEYLKANLTNLIPSSDIEEFVHSYDMSDIIKSNANLVLDKLNDVKVLDPACGSGAFVIGILQKLIALKQLIIYSSNRSRNSKEFYNLKLDTIRNSIYGSDIQPLATELSRLRCWLSLMVDEDVKEIQPLPNLNFKFVTANSLVDLGFDEMLKIMETKKGGGLLFLNRFIELKDKIISLTSEYFKTSTDPNRKDILHKEFKDLQKELTKETISLLASYPSMANFATKFLNWNPFNDNSVAPFFSSTLMFGVSQFDIVIGNPPYIKEYTNKAAFDGIRDSEYYQGKMDIWYFFACRFLDHLKQKTGILTFIATNNWVTNAGASKFRNKVVKDSQILKLIDFGSYMIFESASIQTMVLILKRRSDIDNYTFDYRKLEGEKLLFFDVLDLLGNKSTAATNFHHPKIQKIEYLNKNLTFGSNELAIILSKVQSKSNFQLKEDTEVAQGIVPNPDVVSKKALNKIPISKQQKYNIKVGDPVFVVPTKYFKNLTVDEKNVLKPLYEPTEVSRFFLPNQYSKQIIYITKKTQVNNFPNILSHLDKYREIMDDRRENKKGSLDYYHLHWPRTDYFFESGSKILSVRKCINPTFLYTEKPAYVMMAFNIIRSNRINLKYLSAIFNSSVISFWLKNKGKMQGNNYQVDKEPLLEIPIRKIDNTKPFEILVDYIIHLHAHSTAKEKQLMINYFDNILDAMTYEVYLGGELKKAGRSFREHLNSLIELGNDGNENDRIVKESFKLLYSSNHPVRNNLHYLDSIEDIRIIKESLSKQNLNLNSKSQDDEEDNEG